MIIEYIIAREGVENLYREKKWIKFFKELKWITVLLDKQLLTPVRDLVICDYHLF